MAPFIVNFLSEDDVEGAALLGVFRAGDLFVSWGWASSWAKRSSRMASSCGVGVGVLVAGDALDFFNFPIKDGGLRGRRSGLSNVPGRRSGLVVVRVVKPNNIAVKLSLEPRGRGWLIEVGFIRNENEQQGAGPDGRLGDRAPTTYNMLPCVALCAS